MGVIVKNNGRIVTEIPSNMGHIEAYQVKGTGREQELIQHHMHLCTPEDFPKAEEDQFEEFHLEQAFCIPGHELTIGGKLGTESYEGVVVAIHMCDSTERGNNCSSRMAEYFSKMTFSVIVEDNTISYHDYEKSIHSDLSMVSFTHLYGISEIESRTNRYDQSISLIPSEFIDANNQWSWFFESEEEHEFLGLGRQKISNEPPKLEE